MRLSVLVRSLSSFGGSQLAARHANSVGERPSSRSERAAGACAGARAGGKVLAAAGILCRGLVVLAGVDVR